MYLPLMIDRPVVFPAKAEYFTARGPLGRLWAAYLRSTNQLEMDRGEARSAQATLEAAVEILRAGELFGFYPEGHQVAGRSALPGPVRYRLAGAELRRAGDPGGDDGHEEMLPPGAPLPRPTRIEIRIGKPLEFGHLAGEPPAKARRVVADEVMRAIGDLSGQEYVHLYASDVKTRLAAGDGGD